MNIDTEYINNLILSKGIKKQAIASRLGITVQSLANKILGKTQFTYQEAMLLFDILRVTSDEKKKIFPSK